MPSFSTLADRCGGNTLIRLLALLLVLAMTTPVLLADDGNHEHGKANDLTGVWTQTNAPPSGRKALFTFHQDGTAASSDLASYPKKTEHLLGVSHN
jgi:hypothetical protein